MIIKRFLICVWPLFLLAGAVVQPELHPDAVISWHEEFMGYWSCTPATLFLILFVISVVYWWLRPCFKSFALSMTICWGLLGLPGIHLKNVWTWGIHNAWIIQEARYREMTNDILKRGYPFFFLPAGKIPQYPPPGLTEPPFVILERKFP